MNKLVQIQNLLEFHLGKDYLSLDNRQRYNVYVRSLYCQLAKEFTPYTLQRIGDYIGKTHANVIHSIKLFCDVVAKYEPELYEVYLKVKQYLTNYKSITVSEVNLLTFGVKTN